MKNLIKDILVLFVITLIAGALLGFINQLTKDPIEEYEKEKKTLACAEVFYEEDENGKLVQTEELIFELCSNEELADCNRNIQEQTGGSIVIDEIYRAYTAQGAPLYGYVIGVTTKEGYNGEISFYVGITAEGKMKGVSLLHIAETPGLGMNAENVLLPQFRDVQTDIFIVVKTDAMMPNEIDGISGATVTSEAITEGVNAAYKCYVLLQEGGETS